MLIAFHQQFCKSVSKLSALLQDQTVSLYVADDVMRCAENFCTVKYLNADAA